MSSSVDAEHIGILPSKANGKASNMDHGDAILDIAASSISALGYCPPPAPQDPSLRAAAIKELQSWRIGQVGVDVLMKCLDVGLTAAEVCLLRLRCT